MKLAIHNRVSLLYPVIGCIILCGAVLFSSSSAAAATVTNSSPEPGNYCPGPDILLVMAEDLTSSLDMAMRSRTALINKDPGTTMSDLTSARTALYLAASRGGAARTILLIDAIMQDKTGEDYAQMLTWFPLLQSSMLTLPNDATAGAADVLISQSEAIMQGDRNGNAITTLRDARHMLACDKLDIPLQAAIQALNNLTPHVGESTKPSAYDDLLDSLRSALAYTLDNSEM